MGQREVLPVHDFSVLSMVNPVSCHCKVWLSSRGTREGTLISFVGTKNQHFL